MSEFLLLLIAMWKILWDFCSLLLLVGGIVAAVCAVILLVSIMDTIRICVAKLSRARMRRSGSVAWTHTVRHVNWETASTQIRSLS